MFNAWDSVDSVYGRVLRTLPSPPVPPTIFYRYPCFVPQVAGKYVLRVELYIK